MFKSVKNFLLVLSEWEKKFDLESHHLEAIVYYLFLQLDQKCPQVSFWKQGSNLANKP